MKNFTFISASVFSLHLVSAQAAVGYKCLNFGGIIPAYPTYHATLGDLGLFYNADACAIVTAAKDKYLPDIVLAVSVPYPLCFSSKFIGDLGGMKVLVTADSGITQNALAEYNLANGLPDATAATAFTINELKGKVNNYTLGKYLGTVYTQDQFLNPADAPREYLTVVGGSKQFEEGKGHLVILGDAALGAPVKGTLCFHGR